MSNANTRRRWGKAGQRLTAQEAAEIARRKHQREHQRAADEQETYRAWRAGCVTPWRITAALDLRGLYGPEVDEACGVAEPAVDMWEDGQLYPTWAQLHALAELTQFPTRFFVLGGEPIPIDATSLLCGLTEKQIAQWRREHREPVLEFLPDAIAATVAANPEGEPVERARIHAGPDRAGNREGRPGARVRRDPEPGQAPRRPGPAPRATSPRRAPRPGHADGAAGMTRDEPRRDRTGEIATEPVHHCAGGWMPGHTLDDDEPRPCLICRPHLAPARRQAQVWGNNPDARPHQSARNTSPTNATRENR